MKRDTWDRVDDPDTNPHSYRHLTFDKVSQERNTGEKTTSSTNDTWKTMERKMKFPPCTKTQRSGPSGLRTLV